MFKGKFFKGFSVIALEPGKQLIIKRGFRFSLSEIGSMIAITGIMTTVTLGSIRGMNDVKFLPLLLLLSGFVFALWWVYKMIMDAIYVKFELVPGVGITINDVGLLKPFTIKLSDEYLIRNCDDGRVVRARYEEKRSGGHRPGRTTVQSIYYKVSVEVVNEKDHRQIFSLEASSREKAQKLTDSFNDSFEQSGFVEYYLTEHCMKEINDIKNLIEKEGESSQFYQGIAYKYRELKKYNEAITFAEKAINKNDEGYDRWGHLLLANIYEDKKDYKSSIKEYAYLMSRYDEASWFLQRGLIYKKMNKKQEALQDLKKYLSYEGNDPETVDAVEDIIKDLN